MVKRSYEFVDTTLLKELEQRLGVREEKEQSKVFKICLKCGKRKSLLHFSTAKRNRSGRSGICKACKSKMYLEYYYINRERILSEAKEARKMGTIDRSKYYQNYQEKNKEKLQKLASEWYQKNKVAIKKRNLEYYYANEKACNERRGLWIKNNREKIKLYNREYNRTHKR